MEGEGEQPPKTISRRNFLKGAGAALTATLLGRSTPLPPGVSKQPENYEVSVPLEEKEIIFNSEVSIIDFFEFSSIRDGYNSRLDIATESKDSSFPNRKEIEALINGVEERYGTHGEQVFDVLKKVGETISGQTPSGTTYAVDSAYEVQKIYTDEVGNPTVDFYVNPEKVESIIRQSSDSVINMSFQLGENSAKYKLYKADTSKLPTTSSRQVRDAEGKVLSESATYYDSDGMKIDKEEYDRILEEASNIPPIKISEEGQGLDFVDGYYGEHTRKNVELLVDLANKFPEKIFIAAGGNPTSSQEIPDIVSVKEELTEKSMWPENLLVAGYEATVRSPVEYVGPASYGADIYVSDQDLEMLGSNGASSYATPVITQIVRILIEKGINNPADIKRELSKLTDKKQYWYNKVETDYSLLNFDKVKDSFKETSPDK